VLTASSRADPAAEPQSRARPRESAGTGEAITIFSLSLSLFPLCLSASQNLTPAPTLWFQTRIRSHSVPTSLETLMYLISLRFFAE
jgi:hypothetical protein